MVQEFRGYPTLKTELEEIILSLNNPEIMKEYGCQPEKGILLTGPPGVGKTLIAKILAKKVKRKFYEISPTEILNQYVGNSERNLAKLLDKDGILFFDELDSFRDDKSTYRLVNQLATYLDGIKPAKSFIVGASNEPDLINRKLCRPGRLRRIDIGYVQDVEDITKSYFGEFDYIKIAENLAGIEELTGANVNLINQKTRRRIALQKIRGEESELKTEDFIETIKALKS